MRQERTSGKRLRVFTAALAAGCSSAALGQGGQTPQQVSVPSPRSPIDENGVNLATGAVQLGMPSLTIGSGESTLVFTRKYTIDGWRHNLVGSLQISAGGATTVVVGDEVHTFALNSGGRASAVGVDDPSYYLVREGSIFNMTDGKGRRWRFDTPPNTTSTSYPSYYGRVDAVLTDTFLPTGEQQTFTYKTGTYTAPGGIDSNTGQPFNITYYNVRLIAVRSNLGLQAHFDYKTNDPSMAADWGTITKTTLLSNAVDYCAPDADTCTFSMPWPSVSYTRNGTTETAVDALGRTTTFTYQTFGGLAAIKSPRAAQMSYQYVDNRVSSVTNSVSSARYAYNVSGNLMTTARTDALNHVNTFVSDVSLGVTKSQQDALGRTSRFEYSASGLMTAAVSASGVRTEYTRDTSGRITRTRTISKAGSNLAELNTYATYATGCTTSRTPCDKPLTTTDAMGNVTNYSYDPGHGGLTVITRPAPAAGGARPEVRYSYVGVTPYYKQSLGAAVTAGSASIVRLSGTSSCLTNSSCANANTEVRTSIAYGAAGTANNLFVSSVTTAAGDSSLIATTTYGYDAVGNQTRIDGPMSGDDVVTLVYDAARQLVQTVDGDNGFARRSSKLRYNADGQIEEASAGTSAADGSGFAALQTVMIDYDDVGRKTAERLKMGGVSGTTFTTRQWGYDTADRMTCTVQRMNKSRLDVLPSACERDMDGTDGPDRLTTYGYTNADELETVRSAQGTALAQTTETRAYEAATGLLSSIRDAKSNLTTMSYDGFDRPLRTTYTDGSYEQLGYGAGAKDRLYMRSVRLRDGQVLGMSYDDLGRQTSLDRPGSEPDVSINYDNLGHVTSASSGSNVTGLRWDALGRLTNEDSTYGGIDYQYDLAGRRTVLQWRNSGFYARYTYRANGDLWMIGENGATTGTGLLATYGYDGLGRRSSLVRGNGTTTTWSYDTVPSRATPWVTRINHDLAGTTADVTRTLSYDAAGGILTATVDNNQYAYRDWVNADRTYGVNGLNQYGNAGSATFGYDGRGNLTSSQGNVATTYGYTADNLLTSSSGGGFEYDGLGRLFRLTASGSVLRYEGDQLIGEQNAQGALVQRYIPGLADDEPVAWYEGAAGDRRWFYTDERRSVVAVGDQAGNASRILTYDEYGVPGASNRDLRYQYTGQLWLSEIGAYHYKARVYSPTLGRFLQPDPIGMAGGIHLYAYASNDPVNRSDPTGLVDPPLSGPDIVVTGALLRDIVITGDKPREIAWGIGVGFATNTAQSWAVSSYDRGQPMRLPYGVKAPPKNANDGSILEQRGRRNSTGKRGEAGQNPNTEKHGPKGAVGLPGYVRYPDRNGQYGKAQLPKPGDEKFGWQPKPDSNNMTAAGALLLGGGAIVCAVVEPCGAAVVGALGLSGLGLVASQ